MDILPGSDSPFAFVSLDTFWSAGASAEHSGPLDTFQRTFLQLASSLLVPIEQMFQLFF